MSADILDDYHIITRSWIPQRTAVDPLNPVPLNYNLQRFVPGQTDCFAPAPELAPLTIVTSSYEGDNHPNFDGGYRFSVDATFAWDGQSISNLNTTTTRGVTVRNKVYTNANTGHQIGSCSFTATTPDTPTVAQPAANKVDVTYTGTNPLSAPQTLTPGFQNKVYATLAADGSISLAHFATLFPSAGVRVTMNDQVLLTGIENDVSCLSNTEVLGAPGLARLVFGLTTLSDGGTATVAPGDSKSFAVRSRLCP